MSGDKGAVRAPWWFVVLLVLTVALLMLMTLRADDVLAVAYGVEGVTGWLYPVYAVLSAVLAWICYGQRRTLAWILEGLMLLTAILLYFV